MKLSSLYSHIEISMAYRLKRGLVEKNICLPLLQIDFSFRPSPILLAIGVQESVARNALRLSVGRDTTLDDIDLAMEDIKQAVLQLDNCVDES